MADDNKDVRKKIELTQAQILAGDIQDGQSWQASDTNRRFMKPVAGGTPRADRPLTSDTNNDSAVAGSTGSDALETLDTKIDDSLSGKRDIVHGFVDPDGMVVLPDNATRTVTYSHPSGSVEFWAGKIFFSILNGDARLTVTVANITEASWLYFDIDGQLKYKATLVWADVKTVCLGHLVKYDTSISGFELTIARWEDCQANHVENYASYRSKGIQAIVGEGIGFLTTLASLQVGYTSAAYLTARDFEFAVGSQNFDAINWLRYYYDGLDDVGQYDITLSVSPAPTGSPVIRGTEVGLAGTNAVYNIYDEGGDTFTFAECPSNDFLVGQFGVGDGGSQKVIALAPQGKYSTLGDAQAAIETQERALTSNDNIFRDVAVVASYIVKGNLVGEFLAVDTEGNKIYYHSIAQQGGGASGANNQSLEDVIAIDPISEAGFTIQSSVNPNNKVEVNGTTVKISGDNTSSIESNSQTTQFTDAAGSASLYRGFASNSLQATAMETAQTAQDNAEAGDQGLLSLEGARWTTIVPVTPSLNVVETNLSVQNVNMVSIDAGAEISATITMGNGIITVDTGYRPAGISYDVKLTNAANGSVIGGVIDSTGKLYSPWVDVLSGSYRISCKYPRVT